MIERFLLLLLLAGLAACGELPTPFMGNSGATARRLIQPISPMLAVAPPASTFLPDAAGKALAADLAQALQDAEVPALARVPRPTDWQLTTDAERRDGAIVPTFTVRDPKGESQGTVDGPALPPDSWTTPSLGLLRETAVDASPKIVALLANIRSTRDRADPTSLFNRSAKVMVADVTGAPGDGNQSLTRQMREQLAKFGPLIQPSPSGADFTVHGEVKAVPLPNRQERVEIQWSVRTKTGDERGRVVQLNEIPAGSIDQYWGDIAVVVASEAAAGINDVLNRQSGREPAP